MSSESLEQSRDLLSSAREAGKTTMEGVEIGNTQLSHEQTGSGASCKAPAFNIPSSNLQHRTKPVQTSSCFRDPPVSVPTSSPETCLRWTLLPESQDAQLRKYFKWHLSYIITYGISSPAWGKCLKLSPEHLKLSPRISSATGTTVT